MPLVLIEAHLMSTKALAHRVPRSGIVLFPAGVRRCGGRNFPFCE